MEHHSHARMDDERQPLLINQPPSQSKHDLLQANKARRSILILICISIVAADFGFLLSYAPQIQILESLICERHRSGLLNQPAKSFCKSPQVQGELVLLTGWKDTFDQIPSIVLALPYGYAADRIGRKPVLLLSVTGLILEELTIRLIFWWNDVLPLHAIWFTPFFQTLGGGPQIATSMAYAMVTDIVPSSDRWVSLF
jgi:MFS family permease